MKFGNHGITFNIYAFYISVDLAHYEHVIHLSNLINEHFTNSLFLTKTPIILNDFYLIMSISMDQSLEVVPDSFDSFYNYGVEYVKKKQWFW